MNELAFSSNKVLYAYSYYKGRLERHKLSKDGLHHFLLVVLLMILP